MQATTVAAQGEAKTDFNLAGFSVSLEALRPSVPTAKLVLKKQVDELMAALDTMKKKLNLEFVKDSIRASSSVQQKHEWQKNKQVLLGYEATYAYSFQIDDLDLVSKVYDTLTSLNEVRVNSPYYALKNRDKLNKKALKHAFSKVKDRFESECAVLNLNPDEFEIASWEATYSDSQRSDRVGAATRRSAMGGGAVVACAAAMPESDEIGTAFDSPVEDSELELVVGQAQVTANLEVGYARRQPTAQVMKAKVVKDAPFTTDDNYV